MASVGASRVRLPEKTKLHAALKAAGDVSMLTGSLDVLAKQPKWRENGLRVLLQTAADYTIRIRGRRSDMVFRQS